VTMSVVLTAAPVAVRGLPRLVQLVELKSEWYCNGYVRPASALQVRFGLPLASITAWNSATTVSPTTVKGGTIAGSGGKINCPAMAGCL
jgi:hypothetical protein